jgi:hypothetical protein
MLEKGCYSAYSFNACFDFKTKHFFSVKFVEKLFCYVVINSHRFNATEVQL